MILGVFTNHGYDETVTLAQVFQQRESTGQPYRFFVTATKQLSIATDFADFGSDLRDLRKRLRAAGADIFDEFPKYANLVASPARNPIGAGAGAVPPDRLDEVGRQPQRLRARPHARAERLDRSRRATSSPISRTSTKAHDAVKRAREQLEALEPIVQTAAKYDAALAERDGAGARAVRRPAVHRRASAPVCSLSEIAAARDREARRLWEEQDSRQGQAAGAQATNANPSSRSVPRRVATESASWSDWPARRGPGREASYVPGRCSTPPSPMPGWNRSPTARASQHLSVLVGHRTPAVGRRQARP